MATSVEPGEASNQNSSGGGPPTIGVARQFPRLPASSIISSTIHDCLRKLNPFALRRNPIILAVELGAMVVTVLYIRDLIVGSGGAFELQSSVLLWVTVFSSALAEAIAEVRGKARADHLRRGNIGEIAKRVVNKRKIQTVPASKLKPGDVVIVEAGELIPADGEVIEGIATVDESVITGESAPVIRESGGDRSAVTRGTRVISDQVRVRITKSIGETLLDRMLALMEGVDRQKTPNEVACSRLISGWGVVVLVLSAAFYPALKEAALLNGMEPLFPVALLISLFGALAPTIGAALLSTITIASMDRVIQHNLLATSSIAVEASADVQTFLIDKTGTVTVGDRHAVEFVTFPGVSEQELIEAAVLSSLNDDTPEGHSIVNLAREKYGFTVEVQQAETPNFLPFSPYLRMSGVDIRHRRLRKGAKNEIGSFVKEAGGTLPSNFDQISDDISRVGGTPLVVADGPRALGVIFLKDFVKPAIRHRIEQVRNLGIRSVMITGDNPVTAASIASEIGVDEYIAQATSANKLAYIKQQQNAGRLVAMAGNGTDDAPALAQANVGLVMNTGTKVAKEAGNMVDLDSDPTKVLELTTVGRQLLATRRALLSFSLASSTISCVAILPIMLFATGITSDRFNFLGLNSPASAVLSVLVFNAVVIIALIPLALKGLNIRLSQERNSVGRIPVACAIAGTLVPVPCIWLIDRLEIFLNFG